MPKKRGAQKIIDPKLALLTQNFNYWTKKIKKNKIKQKK